MARFRLVALLPLLLGAPLFAEPLDMEGIKRIYRDGELDAVRERLELFLRRDPPTATREERIFSYKYLGVIYAAKPESRAKAETLFNQALDLSPNLGLAEMYASQPVEDMFLRVKTNHDDKVKELSKVDEFGNPASAPAVPSAPPKGIGGKAAIKSGKPAWPWIVGGAAAATAVGMGVFLWLAPGGGGTKVISAGG